MMTLNEYLATRASGAADAINLLDGRDDTSMRFLQASWTVQYHREYLPARSLEDLTNLAVTLTEVWQEGDFRATGIWLTGVMDALSELGYQTALGDCETLHWIAAEHFYAHEDSKQA